MALIKCEECGKEISQKAKTCPSCGAPVKSIGNALADLQKASSGCSGCLGVAGLVALFFVAKYWLARLIE
jgi:predicted amidophosphoribosyltransferase